MAQYIDPEDPPPEGSTPTITYVTPTNPSVGATIVITGYDFADVNRVAIGTVAIPFTVLDDNTIHATASTAGLSGTIRARNLAGTGYGPMVTVQSVAITADGSFFDATVTQNAYVRPSATVTGAGDTTVGWSSNGGLITAAVAWTQSGVATEWKATTIGTFTVTAKASANLAVSVSKNYKVVAAPVITSFIANPANPRYGESASFIPVFTGGTGAVGTAPVTSGATYYTNAIITPTPYTLVVTNEAGTNVEQTLTLTPQTPDISTIAVSTGNVVAGQTYVMSCTATGILDTRVSWSGPGSFNPAITVSGQQTSWTAPTVLGSAQIKAQLAAYPSQLTTWNTTVQPAPTCTLAVSSLTPARGEVVTVTPTFANCAFATIAGIGNVVSGQQYSLGPITANTSVQLVATGLDHETVVQTPVYSIVPKVVSVTLTGGRPTLTATRNIAELAALVEGAANRGVVWTSSNNNVDLEEVANGDNPTALCNVIPLYAGATTIRATAAADPTKYKEYSITVYDNPVALLVPGATAVWKGQTTSITAYPDKYVTAVVNNGIGNVVYGQVFTTAPINVATTYILTVTNPEGFVSTASVTIRPLADLAGSNSARATASTASLTVRTQFQSVSKAVATGWANLAGGIWLLGFGHGVASHVGGGQLTTQIRLSGAGLVESSASQPELLTYVSLAAMASTIPSSQSLLTVTKPSVLLLHVPMVYLNVDPDRLMLELLNNLDQVLGDTLGELAIYPANLVQPTTTKFVQELLNHYGNPFKFQTEANAAKDLVVNLPYIFSQRGTGVGLQRALRYLLKRDIEIVDFTLIAWKLGLSELQVSTLLGGVSGALVYWIGVPDDYSVHQVRNLKAIVNFMAPISVQFRYIPLSRFVN